MAKLQTVLRVTVTADFPFDPTDCDDFAKAQARARKISDTAQATGVNAGFVSTKVLRTKVDAS